MQFRTQIHLVIPETQTKEEKEERSYYLKRNKGRFGNAHHHKISTELSSLIHLKIKMSFPILIAFLN